MPDTHVYEIKRGAYGRREADGSFHLYKQGSQVAMTPAQAAKYGLNRLTGPLLGAQPSPPENAPKKPDDAPAGGTEPETGTATDEKAKDETGNADTSNAGTEQATEGANDGATTEGETTTENKANEGETLFVSGPETDPARIEAGQKAKAAQDLIDKADDEQFMAWKSKVKASGLVPDLAKDASKDDIVRALSAIATADNAAE